MVSGFSQTYTPDPERAAQYDALYRKYQEVGDILAEHLRNL